MKLIIAILLTTLAACGQIVKSTTEHKKINIDSVDYIEIRQKQNGETAIRLTDQQNKDFVDKWNNSKSKGPCKYMYEFLLTVTLTDGTTRSFITNADNMKENNDWCYSIGDTDFIGRLWTENKK